MRFQIRTEQQEYSFEVTDEAPETLRLRHEDRSFELRFLARGETTLVLVDGCPFEITGQDGRASAAGIAVQHFDEERAAALGRASGSSGTWEVRSPMPGRVVSINCQAGQLVAADAPLLVLEAMKMENELFAPATGIVTEVLTQPNAAIEAGAVLVRFRAETPV